MSRYVLDNNNLWLLGILDRTIRVQIGPHTPDLNTHNPSDNVNRWVFAARIGKNRHCTHGELEVFGVVLNAQKVDELWQNIYNRYICINREGFMFTWHNPSGNNRRFMPGSIPRRVNDLYDWSRHGVQVPLPVDTKWDRFEINTGKLMAGAEGAGSAQMKKDAEEKEKENEKLRAEMDALKKQAKEREDAARKENEELKKQNQERDDAAKKENDELKKQAKEKDDQLAARDKTIGNLRNALASFT